MRAPRAGHVAIAASLCLVAVPGAASAAWSPAERASPDPGETRAPDVAVNARGDAIAAWVRALPGGTPEIVASVRRRGGPWRPAEVVSGPGRTAADPSVAISRRGVAVVVWRQVVRDRVLRVGGRPRSQVVYVAQARARSVAGPFGAIATLSSDAQKVGAPEVAVDGRGTAVAAWHWGTGTRPGTAGYVGRVQVAERRPGGAWTAPRSPSRAAECAGGTGLPTVAVGAGGEAAVRWECRLRGGRTTSYASARAAAPGRWSRERRLPFDTRGAQTADLAILADGTIAGLSGSRAGGSAMRLTWWRATAPAPALDLGLLPAPASAMAATASALRPALRLAAAADGSALGAWVSGGRLVTATLAADGDVGARRALSPASGRARSAGLAVAAAGDGAVAYALTADRALIAAGRSGGAWGPAVPVSGGAGLDAGVPPVVAASAAGATAYWARATGGARAVERADLRLDPA